MDSVLLIVQQLTFIEHHSCISSILYVWTLIESTNIY